MQIKTACKGNMHGDERLLKEIWKSFPHENYDSYHNGYLFSLVYIRMYIYIKERKKEKRNKKRTQLASNSENARDYSHEYNYL